MVDRSCPELKALCDKYQTHAQPRPNVNVCWATRLMSRFSFIFLVLMYDCKIEIKIEIFRAWLTRVIQVGQVRCICATNVKRMHSRSTIPWWACKQMATFKSEVFIKTIPILNFYGIQVPLLVYLVFDIYSTLHAGSFVSWTIFI